MPSRSVDLLAFSNTDASSWDFDSPAMLNELFEPSNWTCESSDISKVLDGSEPRVVSLISVPGGKTSSDSSSSISTGSGAWTGLWCELL